jgi:hypothetical protein
MVLTPALLLPRLTSSSFAASGGGQIIVPTGALLGLDVVTPPPRRNPVRA